MKSKDKNKNIELEEFKYLIDSRNLTSEEKKKDNEAILKARAERFRKRSEHEIIVAKLMQLKYRMEEYLEDSSCISGPRFPEFLSDYIDALYQKRKHFAEAIEVTPIMVSHVINRHREPKESFFHRLIIHSQKTYQPICYFEPELWLKVYFQDKVCSFSKSSVDWIKSEERHVSGRLIEV